MIPQWMHSLNQWLAGSPSLNLVFLLLSLGSLLVSFYLFMKGRREKCPVYLTRTFSLVQNKVAAIRGLTLQFEGRVIESISLSKVALWNKGRETINREDIVRADPLRLELVSGDFKPRILGASVSFSRRAVNGVVVEVSDDGLSVEIKFDYLDYLDGVVIDVYHNGARGVCIRGTIKGVSYLRSARIEENSLLSNYLDPVINPVRAIANGSVLGKFLFVALIVILLPLLIPLSWIESAIRLFQRVPGEFELSK